MTLNLRIKRVADADVQHRLRQGTKRQVRPREGPASHAVAMPIHAFHNETLVKFVEHYLETFPECGEESEGTCVEIPRSGKGIVLYPE